MNIGFDVDGVLTDLEGFQKRTGAQYFRRPPVCPDAYDVEAIFRCTHSEREAYWRKYIWRYCISEPLRADAADVSRALRQQGHTVTIVTARVHTSESGFTGWLFRRMLTHWLKRNGFCYDRIVYSPEKDAAEAKRRLCADCGVDLLVDDCAENLRSVKGTANVLCFTAAWNRDAHWLDAYRVSSFRQIGELLLK